MKFINNKNAWLLGNNDMVSSYKWSDFLMMQFSDERNNFLSILKLILSVFEI